MQIKIARQNEKQEKAAMTIDDARLYMGVSYKVVRRILDSGELPFRQIGRRILISRENIDRWLRFEPTSDGAND